MRGSRATERSGQVLILALLAIILLGGGAYWWLGTGGDPGLVVEEHRSTTATVGEASLIGSGDPGARTATEASTDQSGERSAVAATAGNVAARPFPSDAEWIDVTVVHDDANQERPAADARAVAGMLEHLERALVAVDFLDPAAPKKLVPRLNALFNRANPTEEEIHILRGVAKAMLQTADRARR